MKVKIITETEVLIDLEVGNEMSDEQEKELRVFDEREVVSYNIEFKDGVKLSETHSFKNIIPERVESITVKLK